MGWNAQDEQIEDASHHAEYFTLARYDLARITLLAWGYRVGTYWLKIWIDDRDKPAVFVGFKSKVELDSEFEKFKSIAMELESNVKRINNLTEAVETLAEHILTILDMEQESH